MMNPFISKALNGVNRNFINPEIWGRNSAKENPAAQACGVLGASSEG
jgi:hypothetical protein